jgi:hypothetical protein
MKFENLSNTELAVLIDEWIRGERDRAIMKRRLIDCICFEPLAEEFNLSVQHTQTIVYKNLRILSKKTVKTQ